MLMNRFSLVPRVAILVVTSTLVASLFHPACSAFASDEKDLLTLDEVIKVALRENPDLKLQRLLLQSRVRSLESLLAQFDPVLSVRSTLAQTERGGSSSIALGSGISRTLSSDINLGLTKRFETGSSLSVEHTLTRLEVSTQQLNLPASYSGNLRLTYSAPLFKNRGQVANLYQYWTDEKNISALEKTLEDSTRALVERIFLNYWDIVKAEETVKVRETSLAFGREFANSAREKHRAGVLLKSDVLLAENGALTREASLNDAKRLLEDLYDALALAMGVDFKIGVKIELPEGDIPAIPEDDETIELVLKQDPTLKRLTMERENLVLRERFLTNQLKPDLTLSTGVGLQGETGDLERVYGELSNLSWNIVLSYELPFGKRAERENLQSNQIEMIRKDEEILKRREELKARVRGLLRQLETHALNIKLQSNNIELARENFEMTRARQEVGLATTVDVLDRERELKEAELSYLNALVEYQKSYFSLKRLMGDMRVGDLRVGGLGTENLF